jgi:hypothetical protein
LTPSCDRLRLLRVGSFKAGLMIILMRNKDLKLSFVLTAFQFPASRKDSACPINRLNHAQAVSSRNVYGATIQLIEFQLEYFSATFNPSAFVALHACQ